MLPVSGLFDQHLSVLTDQKLGVAVLGSDRRFMGNYRDIGAAIVQGPVASQVFTA